MDYRTLSAQGPTWHQRNEATNATATCTQAADASRVHCILGFSLSFNAAVTTAVTITLFDGAAILDRWYLPPGTYAPAVYHFPRPIECSAGNKAELTVTAAGVGVLAAATLRGFSVYKT